MLKHLTERVSAVRCGLLLLVEPKPAHLAFFRLLAERLKSLLRIFVRGISFCYYGLVASLRYMAAMAVRFRTKCVKVVHAKRRKQTRSIAGVPAAPQRSQSTLPATYRPQQAKSSQDISQYSRDSYGSAARASQSKKGGVWRVVFIVSIVVFVGALAALGAIGYQYWAQQNAYSGLEEYAEVDDNSNLALSDLKVDWDGLRAINPDIVAWVYVPGTPINYPVVQGSDNQEYLHKAFDGSTGWLASAGTIFLVPPMPATYPIRTMQLYGHHMNDGSMFASLADFEDQGTFDRIAISTC